MRISALSSLFSLTNVHDKQSMETITRVLLHKTSAFHVETDSRVRNDFISIFKKFILKMEHSFKRMVRTADQTNSTTQSSSKNKTSSRGVLASTPQIPTATSFVDHSAFIAQYVNFLISELQPTASYQRHITALKLLELVLFTDMAKLEEVRPC